MARRIADIQQQIIDKFFADENTPTDISRSISSKWLSWTHLVATMIGLFEQILDVFKTEVDAVAFRAGIGTLPWLVDRIFEFQYGNAVVYDSAKKEWSYTDPTFEPLVTRVGLQEAQNGLIIAKVAKESPPTLLDADEKTALNAYLSKIDIGGARIEVRSVLPDKICVKGTVYHDGQYTASVEDSVKSALRTLYDNLSGRENFGSKIRVSDIEDCVRGVEGVSDFKLTHLICRDTNAVDFAAGNKVYVLSEGTNTVSYTPYSGYYIEEDESGQTLDSGLTFSVE